jgi:hypothetical protein
MTGTSLRWPKRLPPSNLSDLDGRNDDFLWNKLYKKVSRDDLMARVLYPEG